MVKLMAKGVQERILFSNLKILILLSFLFCFCCYNLMLSPKRTVRTAKRVQEILEFDSVEIKGFQPEWCISTVYHA